MPKERRIGEEVGRAEPFTGSELASSADASDRFGALRNLPTDALQK
jgi:hypothetical protein